MTYEFTKHREQFFKVWRFTPALFLAQIPEGLVAVLQKFWETEESQHPFLSFFFLYPLYCAATSLGAVLTYTIIRQPQISSFKNIWECVYPRLPVILITSCILGLVMIPATLALILPGIYVLGFYLFVPYIAMDSSNLSVSQLFAQSKLLSRQAPGICFLTALGSFIFGIIGYLVPSSFSQMAGLFSFGLFFEIGLGVLLSLTLNVWISTLYLEVSQS